MKPEFRQLRLTQLDQGLDQPPLVVQSVHNRHPRSQAARAVSSLV